MTLYTESAADQMEIFANAFVCENFAYGHNVVTTFDSLHFV